MAIISVIVPIYNVELYLSRCLNSILNQSYSDIEIILVDDGSTDNSHQLAESFQNQDNRIKLVRKQNGGLSSARNLGISLATGKYISFIDSDDYVEKDFLESLINSCIANETKISMCGRFEKNEATTRENFIFENEQIWDSREAIKRLLTWNGIDSSACDKLFLRELFDDVKFPEGKYNEDIFVLFHLIHKANNISHIGRSKYYYCLRPSSITQEKFSEKKLHLMEASKHIFDFIEQTYPELIEEANSFKYCNLIYIGGLLATNNAIKKHPDYYRFYRNEIFNKILSIIFNEHIPKMLKIKALLICLKLYRFTKK